MVLWRREDGESDKELPVNICLLDLVYLGGAEPRRRENANGFYKKLGLG